MLAHYLSPAALAYAGFRFSLVVVVLVALALLRRRPRPGRALLIVVAMHLACWAATAGAWQRPYGVGEGSDRAFNVGMASIVAAGGSPREHTQAGFASPEPLWNAVVAALAGFEVTRVPAAYAALSPIALVLVAWGVYAGLRQDDDEEDRWERVLCAAAVLGLSSWSLHPHPPAPPFWIGNVLLKPSHALSFGVVALVFGLIARGAPWWRLALALALLGWVFLLHWGYVLPVVIAASWALSRGGARLRHAVLAIAASALLVAPQVLHLLEDYGPFGGHGAARHMWGDVRGLPLAVPNWTTLDLGPLLLLALLGLAALRRRNTPRDRTLLAATAAVFAVWLLSIPAAIAGLAPEPDELHYVVRFAVALVAGAGLSALARHVAATRGWTVAHAALAVLAASVPLSFPAYFDPPAMDRYYRDSTEPLNPRVLRYAEWIRTNTRPDAVFLAGRSAATWIPLLTGRRVLLAEGGKLRPRDWVDRKRAEVTLLTESDPDVVRATARRWGVTHVAVDEPLQHEYEVTDFRALARSPAYRKVFENAAARIVEVTRP